MRHLLNTLYVFTEDAYLALDGENVVVQRQGAQLGRVPLHTLEAILCFTYAGARPALMGACGEHGVSLAFFTPRGRFLARACGSASGNVLLRKQQCRLAEDAEASLAISRNFITGKLFNSRWVLERALRDHGMRLDAEGLQRATGLVQSSLEAARVCESVDSLRGIEGDAASVYFSVFDELILRGKDYFKFEGRVRRPPTDAVNAMLSLFYTVLSLDCAAALEGVGLDPYIGFMHADRPGRKSLALDLMEELRAPVVDRFVLTCINNRVVGEQSFDVRESGEVRLTDDARKAVFQAWQERKKDVITHPFLKEKVAWGLVPHVQALLLARCVRGDLDEYPPFLWK